MNLVFTERARRDLLAISNYSSAHSPTAAVPLLAALERGFAQLQAMPNSGRQTDKPAVRCLIIPRYPYKVFYRVTADAIEILSVFHAARDPEAEP